MTVTALGIPRRMLAFTLDGEETRVPEGATLLDACRAAGTDVPALCHGAALAPRSTCRLCVVEVEGSPALVPACSRRAEPGMAVRTDTERVRHSRRTVLELLASSVDLSMTPGVAGWIEEYGAEPERFGPGAARLAAQPRLDDDLMVRDHGKCILCRRCVDVCGDQGQSTFAIAVSGRGSDTRVTVEYDAPLTDSACAYCGNCLDVCPTGALSSRSEFDGRAAGTWDESAQTRTTTVCGYCGVGCGLTLHVQDNDIVKVTAPHDDPVTRGKLCIKGRFGYQHVQNRG
ncbi:2Fe-2S iron-sulfur cluster-binding protein [Streptomyces sp. WM6386]|uniref:2Fe-2S iron-sulfur cluster-binding protein n=1 Tax=Streptomyces sp. WM6386 TaxID=1415558 RepID=UPI0006194BD4|nr:2Fe-2S iron-sulfur cluster-binding protein [Streptomyces sp. WM6386]KKD08235.1 NADH dehydrogenase [Streptomyces sp. WM6386]